MQCQKCGGEMWDNRAKNRERAAQGKKPMPDYACKDNDGCGGVVWPPKETKAKPAGFATKREQWTWETLESTYGRCVDIAYKQAKRLATAGMPLTVEGVASMAATLFIAASRDGVTDAPKGLPAGIREQDEDMPF